MKLKKIVVILGLTVLAGQVMAAESVLQGASATKKVTTDSYDSVGSQQGVAPLLIDGVSSSHVGWFAGANKLEIRNVNDFFPDKIKELQRSLVMFNGKAVDIYIDKDGDAEGLANLVEALPRNYQGLIHVNVSGDALVGVGQPKALAKVMYEINKAVPGARVGMEADLHGDAQRTKGYLQTTKVLAQLSSGGVSVFQLAENGLDEITVDATSVNKVALADSLKEYHGFGGITLGSQFTGQLNVKEAVGLLASRAKLTDSLGNTLRTEGSVLVVRDASGKYRAGIAVSGPSDIKGLVTKGWSAEGVPSDFNAMFPQDSTNTSMPRE